MKIIDRYICRKFLSTFFFISILVIFLICVFDYMQKGNYFFENHLSYKEIFDYYKAYLPYMFNFIIPVIIFVTALFTTSQLSKRSEILAILGTGTSYGRFLFSFLKPAILLTALSFYINGWVIAKNNEKWIAFEEQYINDYDSNSATNNLHFKVNDDRYITIGKYKSFQKIGYKVLLDSFKDNALQTRISADKIFYDEEKNSWVLHNWTQREILKDEEILTSGVEMFTDIILKPDDISMNPRLQEMLTLTELHQHINALKKQGSVNINLFQVERDVKYMSPFAIIILTIIGVLFASKKSRMGNTIQIIIGCVLAFVYIGLFLFVRGIALFSQINTTLVIWIPNIIFSILVFILYKIVPK